jgi:hypothetical protein
MNKSRRKYKEPVFYFNPDGNCFLDAEYISCEAIILDINSQVPKPAGQIEFSFPNSDVIISCGYQTQNLNGKTHLKFNDLSSVAQKQISNFISQGTKAYSHKPEATL